MDGGRGCEGTRDKGEWRLVEGDPRRPPPPDSRDHPGALLYETQKVAVVKVMCVNLLATSIGWSTPRAQSLLHSTAKCLSKVLMRNVESQYRQKDNVDSVINTTNLRTRL